MLGGQAGVERSGCGAEKSEEVTYNRGGRREWVRMGEEERTGRKSREGECEKGQI